MLTAKNGSKKIYKSESYTIFSIPSAQWAVVILGLAVAGCFRQPVPELDGLPERPADSQQELPTSGIESKVYDVVDGHLLVKVYRAGRLARLGHNHTIEAPISGQFSIAPEQVFADLFVRPADLVVDDPETRAQLGEAFEKPVKPDDVEGTRGNLLSEQVLNPLEYPFVRARIDSRGETTELTSVNFELAGRETVRSLKIETVDDDHCRPAFRGEVRLSHSDFGLTPFSILGGAISVENEFLVSFALSGEPADPGAADCQG